MLRKLFVSGYTAVLPAACALLLLSCKDDPASPPLSDTLSGIIRDEQAYGGAGAVVEALSAEQTVLSRDTADDFGLFTLEKLPSNRGGLLLRVSHSDFKPFLAAASSLPGGAGNDGAVLSMTHQDSACGRLKLTITDYTTRQPIEGAEVRLKRNGVLLTTVLSPANGLVEFNYLMAGTYSLRIAKTGYGVVERGAVIQYCDSSSLDIRMEATSSRDSCCLGVLTIIPIDSATNTPIVGALVKLSRAGMDTRQKYSTAAGVEFGELCDGVYAVRISKEPYRVREFTVTMGCSEIKAMHALLVSEVSNDSCCHGVVQFTIIDTTTRAPINGATVKFRRGSSIIAAQSTGSEGRAPGVARFTNVCEGHYNIAVFADGYAAREFEFTVGCNESFAHTLAMKQAVVDSCHTAVIKVRVKDSTSGTWLSGVTVTVHRGSSQIDLGLTDQEGWYTRQGLTAPATYILTFAKAGYQSKTLHFTLKECRVYEESIKLAP